jgi:hypothetical protein
MYLKVKRKKLTTAAGRPYFENADSMTAGPPGPALLQDYYLREKLAHFNLEHIPGRVMNAAHSSVSRQSGERQGALTPGVIPGVTPGVIPGVTPGVTPGVIPGVTPEDSPSNSAPEKAKGPLPQGRQGICKDDCKRTGHIVPPDKVIQYKLIKY